MVDHRIYRGFLVLVAFAVIVFAFSLQNQPRGGGSLGTPGQFFENASATMKSLAHEFPNRAPGSAADRGLARYVAGQLAGDGLSVHTYNFTAQTALGSRVLETVTATQPGLGGGTIVVVSHRDATSSPGTVDLSGTTVMLTLARALSGETLNRPVMLVSTSGQIGAAGATQLAQALAGHQVDAVISLGDLAGARASQPVIVPWSSTQTLAPPLLRNVLAGFVATETGIKDESSGLAGQFARLAFPFAITEQAPYAGHGIPAVLLSLSGDRPVAAHAALGPASTMASLGTAVLQTVNALEQDPAVGRPSSYLLISGKLVPLWAVQMLVLALLLPVAVTTLDAVARARRRGHALTRWVGWVLTGVAPFVAGLAALLIARAGGLLSATPPGAVAGSVRLTSGDAAVLLVVLALTVASFVFLRPLCLRKLAKVSDSRRRPESPAADAAAVALSAVMCVLTLIVWVLNPFAALLLVPALHLWLWLGHAGARSRRWIVAALLLVGVLPGLLLLYYYANAYGLSPVGLAWSLALMTGGSLSIVTALYWSVALGCLASAIVIGSRTLRSRAPVPAAEQPVVTVRGPVSYAGPGSLGGTESALRR